MAYFDFEPERPQRVRPNLAGTPKPPAGAVGVPFVPPTAKPVSPDTVAGPPTLPPPQIPVPPTGGIMGGQNLTLAGGGQNDYRSIITRLTQGLPPNPQSLAGLEQQFSQSGIQLLKNAQGVATGWIRLPNGQEVDIGEKFSSGDPARMRWQWHVPPKGGSGGAGGPGAPGGPLPGSSPAIEKATEAALLKLLQSGQTPFGATIQDQLLNMIKTGGINNPQINNALIGAREQSAQAMQGQVRDVGAFLAERGQLSTPGVEQGAEAETLRRTAEGIAPAYSDAVRGIYDRALSEQNENVRSALSLATGMSQDQANTILGAVGQGQERQKLFATIALEKMSQNRMWNQFLAEHGLNRDRLQHEIQNGRIDQLLQLLQTFLGGAGVGAGGRI